MTRATSATGRMCSVETLESRRMLANVAVTFNGGLLAITGSNHADALTITTSGNSLIVRPGHNTTVNGSNASFTLPNKFAVTSIFADLRGGDDAIYLDRVDQGLGGTIDTGAGNDAVSLTRSVFSGMLVRTGDGADGVLVGASRLNSVTMDTGRGNDAVAVLANTTFNFSSIELGDGDDRLAVAGNTTFGFTYVSGGGGRDVALFAFNAFNGGQFVTDFEAMYTIG